MGVFSKSESYLGVDIGANGIKLVELKKTKGRPQLWTYGIADEKIDIHLKNHDKTADELLEEKGLDGNLGKDKNKKPIQLDDPRIDKYSNILKELVRRSKAVSRQATASLPVSHIFHTVVTLPKVEEKEITPIIRAKVQKMISRPIEEVQIVHQKIPEVKDAKDIKLLVTAAPKDLVAFYSTIFQRAGLQLEELETEAFALERSLVGRDKATVMVVDIGAQRTNFFIIDQGLPLTHRSISIGGNLIDKIIIKNLGIDPSLVDQVKRDFSKIKNVKNSGIFLNAIDPIVKEIKYSFDLFLHQSSNQGKHPEKIILTGGSSTLPFVAEEIKKKFSMKVFVGDPWARVVHQESLKTELDKIAPRMAVSIGLAMRNII